MLLPTWKFDLHKIFTNPDGVSLDGSYSVQSKEKSVW
jgi:hypothetical protein